jgi:hypothetical protein
VAVTARVSVEKKCANANAKKTDAIRPGVMGSRGVFTVLNAVMQVRSAVNQVPKAAALNGY